MELQELLLQRRSIRAYQAENPVTNEEIQALIEAVHLAPTWKNSQTGRYYIAQSPEMLAKVRGALPSFNQKNSENASALIVTTFVKGIAGFTNGEANNEPGNEWGAYDLGLQNAYLVLKASDLGLDTLIMGLRDADALREILQIPAEEEIMAVIAVGRRAAEGKIVGRKTNEEIAKLY